GRGGEVGGEGDGLEPDHGAPFRGRAGRRAVQPDSSALTGRRMPLNNHLARGGTRHGRGGGGEGGEGADAKVAGGGVPNVVAGQSALSTIDGAKGILSYRGIDIHALAEHSSFEEVVFLLHRGTLPTRAQLTAFSRELAEQRKIPDGALSVLHALPRSAHPMTALRTVVSALGALDPDAHDDGEAARNRKALRLCAQMGTVVTALERVRNGWAPASPHPGLSHPAQLLYIPRGQRPR